MKRHIATTILAGLLLATSPTRADGPGIPSVTFTDGQLFKSISVIKSNVGGSARGHGNTAMFDGYFFVPMSRDEGAGGGAISFYDISDPAHPVKVSQINNTNIREPHGFGFSYSYPGHYAVLQATDGLQFWNFSNPLAPVLIKDFVIPNTKAEDYDHVAWWAFWQAPYVYVGGGLNGFHIVDATDPANPTRVGTFSAPFRVGSTFAVGNLLVLMASDRAGLATYDISDPSKPIRLVKTNGESEQYSGVVNGNRIITSGNDNKLHVYDITDPTHITPVTRTTSVGDKGGYPIVQDGFALSGFSAKFAKVNLSNMTFKTGSSGIADRDEDFATAIGNMVFVGSDHPVGSGLFPHQGPPDTTGPTVNMVNPKNGATNQALTSRVGITLTDQIDLRTVNNTTFIVRPQGGSALAGKYSGQSGILSFFPSAPLQPNTTYEVVVPANGLKDWAGNQTPGAFTSTFTTRQGTVAITNLSPKDTASAADWSVRSNIQVGDNVYGDRTFTFATIPAALVGQSWIRTANDSKTSTADPQVTFTVGENANVNVALNNTQPKPSWVDNTWTNTNTTLTTKESASVTRTYNIYRKSFSAGSVALGPWGSTASMYTIIVTK